LVAVMVGVRVTVAVAVIVGVPVIVAVRVRVAVRVKVDVPVMVAVRDKVGVPVAVLDAVAARVGVRVEVAATSVDVQVGVEAFVAVRVAVENGVAVLEGRGAVVALGTLVRVAVAVAAARGTVVRVAVCVGVTVAVAAIGANSAGRPNVSVPGGIMPVLLGPTWSCSLAAMACPTLRNGFATSVTRRIMCSARVNCERQVCFMEAPTGKRMRPRFDAWKEPTQTSTPRTWYGGVRSELGNCRDG